MRAFALGLRALFVLNALAGLWVTASVWTYTAGAVRLVLALFAVLCAFEAVAFGVMLWEEVYGARCQWCAHVLAGCRCRVEVRR